MLNSLIGFLGFLTHPFSRSTRTSVLRQPRLPHPPIRPSLEKLEDRTLLSASGSGAVLALMPGSEQRGNNPVTPALTTPSVVVRTPIAQVQPTHSMVGSTSMMTAAAPPIRHSSGVISFTPLGTQPFDYYLTLTITLAEGKPQVYKFHIGANTDPKAINSLVLSTIGVSKGGFWL